MRFVIAIALIAAAHFSLTPFAPSARAWLMWPFALDSRPALGGLGGLPG